MSGSMNKVILIGNVGKDPEVRSFNNGGKVANFSIATSESWKDKQSGEKRTDTQWHNIAIFGDGLVGIVERYVSKGTKVAIEGKLKTRKWQDRDGNDRYTTEVVVQGFGGGLTLLGSKNGDGGGSSGYNSSGGRSSDYGSHRGGSGSSQQSQGNQGGGQDFDLDDEIPF